MTRYYINDDLIAIRAFCGHDQGAQFYIIPGAEDTIFSPSNDGIITDCLGANYQISEFAHMISRKPLITEADFQERFGEKWLDRECEIID